MVRRSLTLPELGIIAGTRAAFGAGLGLLLADRLDAAPRRAVGWTLLTIGALTTVPIAIQLFAREDSGRKTDDSSFAPRWRKTAMSRT
jgi:hypothetical protein